MAEPTTIDTRVNPHIPEDIHDRVVALVQEKTRQETVPHVPYLTSPEAEAAIFENVSIHAQNGDYRVWDSRGDVFVLLQQLPLDDLDTFVLVDAAFSVRKYQRWSQLIPRIKPHLGT